MIDPKIVEGLKPVIPPGENVLYTGRPNYRLFSAYNLANFLLYAVPVSAGIVSFFISYNGVTLSDFPPIFLYFLPVVIIVLLTQFIWIITKPKYDSIVVTDTAFYIRRRGLFRARMGRLPHLDVLEVKRLFGMKDTISLVYSALDHMKLAMTRVWDLRLFNRHAIHIRDVPDMDVLLHLLCDKGILIGNQHR